jgi:hypothetical protein
MAGIIKILLDPAFWLAIPKLIDFLSAFWTHAQNQVGASQAGDFVQASTDHLQKSNAATTPEAKADALNALANLITHSGS